MISFTETIALLLLFSAVAFCPLAMYRRRSPVKWFLIGSAAVVLPPLSSGMIRRLFFLDADPYDFGPFLVSSTSILLMLILVVVAWFTLYFAKSTPPVESHPTLGSPSSQP